MSVLNSSRKKIDIIDKKIAILLLQRFKIAKQISLYKKKNKISIKNYKREAEVLKNISKYSRNNKFVIDL
jgi:chorismate mutase